MHMEEFDGCCGICILAGLDSPYDHYSRDYYNLPPKRTKQYMEDTVDPREKDDPLRFYQAFADMKENRYGFAFATTVNKQKVANVQLKKHGFKRLLTFKNPNTNGTVVTLWCRAISTGMERFTPIGEIFDEAKATLINVDAKGAIDNKEEKKEKGKKTKAITTRKAA